MGRLSDQRMAPPAPASFDRLAACGKQGVFNRCANAPSGRGERLGWQAGDWPSREPPAQLLEQAHAPRSGIWRPGAARPSCANFWISLRRPADQTQALACSGRTPPRQNRQWLAFRRLRRHVRPARAEVTAPSRLVPDLAGSRPGSHAGPGGKQAHQVRLRNDTNDSDRGAAAGPRRRLRG